MAIDIEKILTISASEYVEMSGRSLRDYEASGVHTSSINDIEKNFARLVPDGVEVVVGYRMSLSEGYAAAYGTALIRKPTEGQGRDITIEEGPGPKPDEPFVLVD